MPLLPKFCFAGEEVSDAALALTYRDEDHGLTYTAHFALDADTHVLTARSVLEADAPLHLHWLAAPVIPPHSIPTR